MSNAASLREEHGFTLLELLVSVGIVGVLAAIAVPTYHEFKERARVASTAADLRNFASGFFAYQIDNGDFPPDTNLILPAGVEDFIPLSAWNEGPAIGGAYNWEGPSFYPYAGIAIMNPPGNDILTSLDQQLDDGDLGTGKFRIEANGRPTYIISE